MIEPILEASAVVMGLLLAMIIIVPWVVELSSMYFAWVRGFFKP